MLAQRGLFPDCAGAVVDDDYLRLKHITLDGAAFAMRGGALGRAVYPLVLLTFPLILLMPLFTVLLAMPAAIDGSPLARFAVGWAIAAGAGVFATFAVANRSNRDSAWRALLAPLGAAILLWICASAIGRGRRVRWKGRAYVAR